MATPLIAIGTGALSSGDIVAAAGTPVTVFLKTGTNAPADSGAACIIEIKGSGSNYHQVGVLDGSSPIKVIDGPGTYRVTRTAASASCGVDQG